MTKAITAALTALLDWGREHTSPTDANSPHELLIAAKAALDAKGYPVAPAKFRDQLRGGTSLLLEAALCAFEWMIANRFSEDESTAAERDPEDFPDWKVALNQTWDGMGWSAMRHMSMQAGAIVLTVWDHMTASGYEHNGAAYDWEFVPAVMSRLDWEKLADDNQYTGVPYWPDPAPIFAAMLADDPEHFETTETARRTIWMGKARAAAINWWAFPTFADENPETFDAAFKRGDDPEEFVKQEGERLDLHKFGKAWG